MKTFLLWMLTLFALSSDALLGQDLTGTWQGALQLPNGKELRTVIKIAKADGSTLTGTMYSIDQGGQPIPVNSVTLQGSAVKMTVTRVGGSYEGKLDADGAAITGNWKQGPQPIALNLKRATAETAWAIPDPPPPPKPMAENFSPEFEVATIKPSAPDKPGKGFMVRGRQFSTMNTSLNDLISFAYGIHAKQITGGPAWFETEKFDISAQPNGEGQPNHKQWTAMLQKLMADRFKLAFHRDKKELSVYAIVVAKSGPKMTKNDSSPNGLPALFFRGLGVLPASNATMTDFAGLMQSAVLDRPVVDKTGLTGRWDFTLTWTPDEFQFGGMAKKMPPPPNDGAAPPDLFTAFQEQLGLKLESTKSMAEVFVIDRVAKPTDN